MVNQQKKISVKTGFEGWKKVNKILLKHIYVDHEILVVWMPRMSFKGNKFQVNMSRWVEKDYEESFQKKVLQLLRKLLLVVYMKLTLLEEAHISRSGKCWACSAQLGSSYITFTFLGLVFQRRPIGPKLLDNFGLVRHWKFF